MHPLDTSREDNIYIRIARQEERKKGNTKRDRTEEAKKSERMENSLRRYVYRYRKTKIRENKRMRSE